MNGDRQQLLVKLQMIQRVLAQISEGAGFCEDRGFGWTIENERRAGIDDVRATFHDWHELVTLLPKLAELTHDAGRVIGLESIPHDEVKLAIRRIKRERREQGPA